MSRCAPLCLLLVCSPLWAASQTTKAARPFELFSVPPPGCTGPYQIWWEGRISVSDDDRFLAFYGFTSGWGADEDLGAARVWLYDRLPGVTRLVSTGATGPYEAHDPMVSGDGSTILLFASGLWVIDRESGKRERVDIRLDGTPSNAGRLGEHATISDNGRLVAFTSGDYEMLPGGVDGCSHVFVRDVKLNTTTVVSRSTSGALANGTGCEDGPVISGDGSSVAFTAWSTNLVAGASWTAERVYVRRLTAATTELVSRNTRDGAVAGYSPGISDNGRFVAFTSQATLVDEEDTSSNEDVFVRDTSAGRTQWASKPNGGVPGGAPPTTQGSRTPVAGACLSDDGRYVVFSSDNPWLLGSTMADHQQVLRHEWCGRTTIMSSVTASEYADDDCYCPVTSGRGDYVYFHSAAGNLGVGANEGTQLGDVFGTRGARYLCGRVTWKGGGALAGTSILVKGTDGGGTEYWTHADAQGKWQVTGLTLGNYSITPYRAGCTFSPPARQVGLGPSLDSQWFQGTAATGDGLRRYRALLVGVSDYVVNSMDLSYCDDDALDLRSQLLASRNWQGQYIRTVLDSQATRRRIKDELAALAAQSDADDVCLVTFSGHGQHTLGEDAWPLDETDSDDEFLCPTDSTWTSGLIGDDEFGHWLNRFGTANYAVILDCCHSGGQINKGTGRAGERIRSQPTGRRGRSTGDGVFGGFWLPRPAGTRDLSDLGIGAVLAAANKDETAAERSDLQHGLFTNFLLEAMRGRAGDTSGDGVLTAAELFSYAGPRTTGERDEQHPVAYYGEGGAALALLGKPRCPDLKIGTIGGPLVGNDEYGALGRHQVLNQALTPGSKLNLKIALQNDSTTTESVRLLSRPGTGKFGLRYLADGVDITDEITSEGGWLARGLDPGETILLYLRVAARPAAVVGDVWQLRLWAELQADATHADCVGCGLEVLEPPETTPPPADLTLTATAGGGTAEVALRLQAEAAVTVEVCTIAGAPVRRLATARACGAGLTRLSWNLRSDRGLRVPSGRYLVRATAAAADGSSAQSVAPLAVR